MHKKECIRIKKYAKEVLKTSVADLIGKTIPDLKEEDSMAANGWGLIGEKGYTCC